MMFVLVFLFLATTVESVPSFSYDGCQNITLKTKNGQGSIINVDNVNIEALDENRECKQNSSIVFPGTLVVDSGKITVKEVRNISGLLFHFNLERVGSGSESDFYCKDGEKVKEIPGVDMPCYFEISCEVIPDTCNQLKTNGTHELKDLIPVGFPVDIPLPAILEQDACNIINGGWKLSASLLTSDKTELSSASTEPETLSLKCAN